MKTCWLCGRNGAADPLDQHHIFGGPNRKLSDRFGLTVYLCHHDCHIFGEKAVHRDPETAQRLHEYGQRKAMEEQGWTVEQFRMVFGKNYIDPDEEETDCHTNAAALVRNDKVSGFRVLDMAVPF